MNTVNAQKARQVLELMVGYKISPKTGYIVLKNMRFMEKQEINKPISIILLLETKYS